MKKIGRLLLYVILSTCFTYFLISNLNNVENVRMTVDFIKHGSETDVVAYSKKVEEDFKKTLQADEEASNNNNSEATEDKKTDEKENNSTENNNKQTDESKNTTKKNSDKQSDEDKDEEKKEEEKKYENMYELAKDYPMGVVFYSMTMTRGEVQIETLCASAIYGMVVGIIIFMFSVKEPTNIKEGLVMYIIALVCSIVSIELVQMVTLILAYGTIYFVNIQIQYILFVTAVFFIILAMKKTLKKDEEKMKEIKAEFKNKINSKKKDRK